MKIKFNGIHMRILFILYLCAMTCFFHCTHSEHSQQNNVVIGLRGDVDSFNELNASDSDALQIIDHMLFMSLIKLNEQFEHVPDLAKEWKITESGRRVTFVLRDDVLWSDGAPTTADDVVFTYNAMTNPDVAYPAVSRFDLVNKVEKVDDYTLQFYLTRAYPDVLYDLSFPILPKHVLDTLSVDELLTSSFNRNPIGNGPYVLQEWQANRAISFKASDQYVYGRPAIDRITFTIIPDEHVLLANLLSHDVDLVPRISPDNLNLLESDSDINITTFEGKRFTFVGWNTARPVFSLPIRRALSHAIKKQEIISALLGGYGKPAIGPLTSVAWAFDSSLQDIPYNPSLAKRLLAENGWQDRNGDGVREKNGKEFIFTLKINVGSQQRQDIAVLVQSQLAEIGVQVKIQRVEWNLFLDQVFGKKEFDAVVLTWDSDFTVDPTPLWHSQSIENGYNFVSYANERVDMLIEKARQAPSQEQAQPLWSEFQQIVINDCPYTFLFIPDEIISYTNRLSHTEFDLRGYLANCSNWAVKN